MGHLANLSWETLWRNPSTGEVMRYYIALLNLQASCCIGVSSSPRPLFAQQLAKKLGTTDPRAVSNSAYEADERDSYTTQYTLPMYKAANC